MIIIKEPNTHADWEAYYTLRYTVLREPWGQPKGSEVLEDEPTAIHALAINIDKKVVGVARIHQNSTTEAQVRCVAVYAHAQGTGVGKALMQYLEQKAIELGCKTIILEARENALPFYLSIGYKTVKDSYLLFGEIQHYTMIKEL